MNSRFKLCIGNYLRKRTLKGKNFERNWKTFVYELPPNLLVKFGKENLEDKSRDGLSLGFLVMKMKLI